MSQQAQAAAMQQQQQAQAAAAAAAAADQSGRPTPASAASFMHHAFAAQGFAPGSASYNAMIAEGMRMHAAAAAAQAAQASAAAGSNAAAAAGSGAGRPTASVLSAPTAGGAAAASESGGGGGGGGGSSSGHVVKVHPAVRLFEAWHASHPVHRSSFAPLSELPVETLNAVIGDWILQSRKSNGGDYTPDTLYVYLSSLQRHIRRTHGLPHFQFLEGAPVRDAMEHKFGRDAMQTIMLGGRYAGSEASAAAAAANAQQQPVPDDLKLQLPPSLARKRQRNRIANKGRTGAGSAGNGGSSAANNSMHPLSLGNLFTVGPSGGLQPSSFAMQAASQQQQQQQQHMHRSGSGRGGVPGMVWGGAGAGLGLPQQTGMPGAGVLTFKPPKPSHSHRSFRTEQRLLSVRQDPSTPEGLLRCLLWIIFTHVPTLTKNACWALKTSQFHVRVMAEGGESKEAGAAAAAAAGDASGGAASVPGGSGDGKTIRFLQYTPARKLVRPDSRAEHISAAQQEVIMYEQPSMPHCCPVALFEQFVAHRPHGKFAAAKAAAAAEDDGDAGSYMWLLTRKHIETSGEDAGVWYANRRIGQGTMDKLIAVVRASRNQPPEAGVNAIQVRAAKLESEDAEDSRGGAVEHAQGSGVADDDDAESAAKRARTGAGATGVKPTPAQQQQQQQQQQLQAAALQAQMPAIWHQQMALRFGAGGFPGAPGALSAHSAAAAAADANGAGAGGKKKKKGLRGRYAAMGAASAAVAAASAAAAAAAAAAGPHGLQMPLLLPPLPTSGVADVHEYIRAFTAHIAETKANVAEMERSLGQLTAMVQTGAMGEAAATAAVAQIQAAQAAQAAAAAAAAQAAAAQADEDDGEDDEDEDGEEDEDDEEEGEGEGEGEAQPMQQD